VRCVSSDGTVTVETIRLSGTNGRDGEWLRVKRHDYQWADVRTVNELTRLGIDLADQWVRAITPPEAFRKPVPRADCPEQKQVRSCTRQ
jgi:hypothetical protein